MRTFVWQNKLRRQQSDYKMLINKMIYLKFYNIIIVLFTKRKPQTFVHWSNIDRSIFDEDMDKSLRLTISGHAVHVHLVICAKFIVKVIKVVMFTADVDR